MRYLVNTICAALVSAGLSVSAYAAEANTEKGQTPAAPSNAGADSQPNKAPTPVMTNGAKVMSNGAKEAVKKGADGNVEK